MQKVEKKGNVSIIAPEIKFLENKINIRLPIPNIHEVRQNYILSKKSCFFTSARCLAPHGDVSQEHRLVHGVSRVPNRNLTRLRPVFREWCLARFRQNLAHLEMTSLTRTFPGRHLGRNIACIVTPLS